MKLNDLMVGDWVKVNGLNLKVGAIHADEIGVFDPDYKIYWCSDDGLDRVYPIPLTEEILVKNRFALDKTLAEIGTKVYTRPCPASELSVKVFHDGSIRFGFIKLTYVHTLQHLLRLCGIEKEIEL